MKNPLGADPAYSTPGYNNAYFDPEAQSAVDYVEDNKYARQIRHGFIRKVYGILAMQLTITAALSAYFTFDHVVRSWVVQNYWMTLVAGITAIALLLVLVCVPDMSQRFPTNYVLLFLFTGCEALVVGGICAQTSLTSGGLIVFQAALATAIITIMLTLFAFQTKWDFTSYMGIMFYVTIAASIFALFTLFFRNTWYFGIISAAFALIMCAHIVIDTQHLIGTGKIRASEDQYILCSAMLYLDIINLFVYLLRLIQLFNRNN